MYLTTEYDGSLELKEKLPPTVARDIYLREGVSPVLDLTPSPFGKPVFYVYLGYSLKAVEEFLITASKHKEYKMFLISPLGRWNLYLHKFKNTDGVQVLNEFDTYDAKIKLIMRLTGMKVRETKMVFRYLNNNLTLLDKNLDLIISAVREKKDVGHVLLDNQTYSYTDILFYLCGSKTHSRERFVITLDKYRYAYRSIMKFLKGSLDAFIGAKLYGEKPADTYEYIVVQLSRFLYLEEAMILRQSLNSVKHLEQLLINRGI